MGFDFEEPNYWVGKKFKVLDPGQASLTCEAGTIVTVDCVEDSHDDAACMIDNHRFYLNDEDIENGYIVEHKEEDMGLQLPTEPQVAQPQVKHPELVKLEQMIHLARTEPDPIRQDILDCINQRYRSTAYRDMIKKLVSGGGMGPQDRDEMQRLLAGIRSCTRTPHAKAYRYQWP